MPRIRIFLMGPPRIERENRPVELKRRKTTAVLAYLALNPRTLPREALAGLFWPDADQSAAFAYLRHTLWEIGAVVGPEVLQTSHGKVEFSRDPEIWVDALRFDALLTQWKVGQDHRLLEEAVGLYQADFLDRFVLKDAEGFDTWQHEQTEAMRSRFGAALEALAGYHLSLHAAEPALLHARRWLSLDNLHEAAHRIIIEAELLAGHRSAALRQYDACVRILTAELGVEPDPTTRSLLEKIRSSPAETTAPIDSRPPSPFTSSEAVAVAHAPDRPPGLPRDPAPFIGRRMELGEIAYRLRDPECRLLTLLGPGGIGKTRLALRAADEMSVNYPDGVLFISLVAIPCEQFLPALSTALQIQGDPTKDDDGGLSRLCTFIQNKNILIVLDNMEHLTGCADSVQTMLTTAPRLNLLITSRERLNLPGEWCLEVGGMSYPFGSESGFEDYSAVQLFLHTARRVKANFQIAPGDRVAITRICRLVEGMPLGIELAATWVRLLSPGDILREIENSLDFLTSSQRGIPERHRSLRAIYESSQEMLTSSERDGFHRLALIPGSFTREVASQEAGVNLPLLSALVDKSFIRYQPNGRYDLHEVLRKYASENQHFGYNADSYGR